MISIPLLKAAWDRSSEGGFVSHIRLCKGLNSSLLGMAHKSRGLLWFLAKTTQSNSRLSSLALHYRSITAASVIPRNRIGQRCCSPHFAICMKNSELGLVVLMHGILELQQNSLNLVEIVYSLTEHALEIPLPRMPVGLHQSTSVVVSTVTFCVHVLSYCDIFLLPKTSSF